MLQEKILNPALNAPTDARQRLHQAGRLIIVGVGESPNRSGIERTPERFAAAFSDLTSGYQQTPERVVGKGVFPAEGRGLISVNEVEFYSLCEHHLLPFWGKVSVAYYPDRHIVGLSKIPRIIDCFARRLQVQERLTREIAEGLAAVIKPRAVAVRVEAEHMCMRMRGIRKQGGLTKSEYFIGIDSLSEHERKRIDEIS